MPEDTTLPIDWARFQLSSMESYWDMQTKAIRAQADYAHRMEEVLGKRIENCKDKVELEGMQHALRVHKLNWTRLSIQIAARNRERERGLSMARAMLGFQNGWMSSSITTAIWSGFYYWMNRVPVDFGQVLDNDLFPAHEFLHIVGGENRVESLNARTVRSFLLGMRGKNYLPAQGTRAERITYDAMQTLWETAEKVQAEMALSIAEIQKQLDKENAKDDKPVQEE